MAGEVADLPLEPAERGAGEGEASGDTGVRDGEASREIVAPVEHDCGATEGLRGVGGGEPGDDRVDFQRGIEAADPICGGLRLWPAEIRFCKDGLALQIAGFDHIGINERQRADTRSGEVLDGRAADAAAADDGDMRAGERDLASAADFGKDDVAGEAIEAVWG